MKAARSMTEVLQNHDWLNIAWQFWEVNAPTKSSTLIALLIAFLVWKKKRTLELSQLSLKRENYFNTTREKDLTNETTRRQGSHITRL